MCVTPELPAEWREFTLLENAGDWRLTELGDGRRLEHGKGRRLTELAGGRRFTTLEQAEAEGRLFTTALSACGRVVTFETVLLQQVKLRSLLSRVLHTADLGT